MEMIGQVTQNKRGSYKKEKPRWP